jgi:selenocysteine lyase/cysteine desulfurase
LGEPLEYSWMTKKGSAEFTSLTNYVSGYRTGARKFDMGEFSQINLLPMAIAALEQIIKWDITYIQTYIKRLTDTITLYKTKKALYNGKYESAGHITSIPLNYLNVKNVKERLQSNKIIVSLRGTSIRVSPHLYNHSDDIDKLLDCLND